jgi:hypothetical protein
LSNARNFKSFAALWATKLLASGLCVYCNRLTAFVALEMHFCAHSLWSIVGLRLCDGGRLVLGGFPDNLGRRLFPKVTAAEPALNRLSFDKLCAKWAFFILRIHS